MSTETEQSLPATGAAEHRVPAPRDGVIEMEESLAGMRARLAAVLDGPPLTQDTLVEIMSIYNNVAYVFLYLEAVDDHENLERLRPWRTEFYENAGLDDEILARLLALDCADPEVEAARLEYIDQLRKSRVHDPEGPRRLDALLTEAKALTDLAQQDQKSLLERLGVPVGGARPQVVFYKLMGNTANPATRAKLARAWRGARAPHVDELAGVVDRMITERRAQAAAAGLPGVLARTMERCKADEDTVETVIRTFLSGALTATEELEREIREVTGAAEGRPLDHFEYAVQQLSKDARIPSFDLEECLAYIFRVARSVFGLTFTRTDSAAPGLSGTDLTATDLIAVDVAADGVPVGGIKFDLWDLARKSVRANHTRGIRNRTDWSDIRQLPVAYVSCRFRTDDRGSGRITFQNVHSLFHEFGHAVNHLLVRKRTSYQSGLEYLPPERLECLSMWFEKWVHHPSFAASVTLPEGGAAELDRCRLLAAAEYRRTYVERAVTAWLDLDVHRGTEGGLRDSYRRLDEEFGVSRYVPFDDIVEYFTWPMYMAHPGANFSYLWGSADSCEKFLAFRDLTLDEIAGRPGLRALFGPCFDFDEPSDPPAAGSVFTFFGDARLEAIA
ncbi:M3 family metallopeptidase [Streptomyces sp. NPDC060184]|uniref:M3 family metallopeptidase n=1 Tax=Streptomyces sp. NPDC060184 TaxID=3347064 RepID=UPI003654E3E7